MINQHDQKRPASFCECGDHAWLTLTRGSISLIDVADAAWAARWNWTALVRDNKRTAVRRENRGRYIYLHREIAEPAADLVVDHKNGNSLDNRRRNLRACIERLNLTNVRARRTPMSSRFKGVYHDKERGTWQAYVTSEGKRYRLGRFKSELDAAMAYDAKAAELHGEFAMTNKSLGLLP